MRHLHNVVSGPHTHLVSGVSAKPRMATFVKGYMMTGEKRKFEVSPSVVHKKAVSNDLLSNILRGLVHGIPEDQIIQVIDEHFNPEEVFDARVVLFKNFYSIFANDPNDPTEDRVMGAKEKEIKKRWHIQDILEKIHVIGKLDHDVEFCVPFNYRFVIMTEEEKRYREILDEKSENLDDKFEALEKVIDLQNRATIMAVEKSMKESLETVKDVVNEKKLEATNGEAFDDAEFFKGNLTDGLLHKITGNTLGSAETLGSKDGHSTRYIPRHLDIQILNSLILICIFGFIVRFAQLFLNKFSINV